MKKSIISICLIFALVLPLCALFGVKNYDEKSEFATQLVKIYQKYDKDVESDSEFALRRLMLSDYSGDKTYGATDFAIDKKHGFAVLQYETEEQAKRAFELIKKDNIPVDCDSRASLDSVEKGKVHPEGSRALGTASYISKFNMKKDDVVVAVIDTGVMYDHELMANRFVSRGYDFSDDGRNNAYYDTQMRGAYYGHATFVCGIIADNTPDNVKILPYKTVAFGETDASNTAMVAAIYDAIDKDVDVINVSMSASSGASAFKYAVEAALKKNICICASAGNNSQEIKYRYPSAISGVITASAVESDMETFASFSNYGSAVDFCAPGRNIVSACPYKTGEEKYTTNSGTSFSAPYISAVCSNIKSINTSFTKDEVYSVMCDFSKDLGAEGYDVCFGNGMPNLGDMVYTDNENYFYNIPEGYLFVANSIDYTLETQPWRLFADKMLKVQIDDGVDSIGSYAFYNMKEAVFEMPETFINVGEGAFYSCKSVKSIRFDENVLSIGENAFGELDDDFTIYGFRNTAAEVYSNKENISFKELGCKHNYVAEVVEPTDEASGYTVYTCSVCKDYYIGDYIEPPEYYEGDCGMGVKWKYTTKSKTLEISGQGYMNSYSSETQIPWRIFMNKIKEVIIGEDITFISDYTVCNADSIQSIKIYSKKASLSDKTFSLQQDCSIYVFEDSKAKDYLSEKEIAYISLGCAHSREIEYSEEQPSCCFDTFGVYRCKDCGYTYKEYISLDNKGHYLSGSIKTLSANPVKNAEIYIDGVLSAKSNPNGGFAVYPVLCGTHSVEIKLNSRTLYEFEMNPNRNNIRSDMEICFGDFDSNGYINAKDFAYALRNDFDGADILDYGRAADGSVSLEGYEKQELPYAVKLYNEPNDDSNYKRDFIAAIENYSEFEIKESGFVYGKNMSEDMLFLENVGRINEDGYSVKKISSTDNSKYEKVLTYGSSSRDGTLSARFYIIYSNGVTDYTYYSGVTAYEYPNN